MNGGGLGDDSIQVENRGIEFPLVMPAGVPGAKAVPTVPVVAGCGGIALRAREVLAVGRCD